SRRRRDPDDRTARIDDRHASMVDGVAERRDATIAGRQPVALAVGRACQANDRLVEGDETRRAEESGIAVGVHGLFAGAGLRRGDILLEQGLVAEQELAHAVEIQTRDGGRLGQILLEQGIVTPVGLLSSLASQFGVDLVDLDTTQLDLEAVALLPPGLTRRHRALPIGWDPDGTLVVAMSNPVDLFAL